MEQDNYSVVLIRSQRLTEVLTFTGDWIKKGKGSPYSITEHRVPVLGSQPAGDVSHKPGGRLPLLSARPEVTHATLLRKGCYQYLCLVELRHDGCEQFA